MVDVGFEPTTPKNHGLSTTPFVKDLGWGHRVPPAGLLIEQVLDEYVLTFFVFVETQLYTIPTEPRTASDIGCTCLRSIS